MTSAETACELHQQHNMHSKQLIPNVIAQTKLKAQPRFCKQSIVGNHLNFSKNAVMESIIHSYGLLDKIIKFQLVHYRIQIHWVLISAQYDN